MDNELKQRLDRLPKHINDGCLIDKLNGMDLSCLGQYMAAVEYVKNKRKRVIKNNQI